MNRMIVAAVVVGWSVIASAAVAADRHRLVVVTESVRADDLDLNTPAGAQQMFLRIKGAAGSACYQTHSPALPLVSHEVARCSRVTIARAVAALSAPMVTAAYEAWSRAPAQTLASR